ncbi:MAG: 1,4-alpha-glucan branching enzyme [Lachnospiraceae bacterium]|nr:1,4-alpha-glucan branching enzyme [Lachnospiraceae bacterium]
MKKKLYKFMNWPVIEAITYREESHPFETLGTKSVAGGTLFQTYYPDAVKIKLILDEKEHRSFDMEMADEMGFFAQIVPGKITCDYEYEVTAKDGGTFKYRDPYRYDDFFISEKDSASFSNGTDYRSYELLGAFSCKVNGVKGVRFALWAPCALSVCVLGDFNDFTSGMYPMQLNDRTGIYEIFIPGIGYGNTYYYEIKTKNGTNIIKPDPYSKKIVASDERICSVIYDDKFAFSDDGFISGRETKTDSGLSVCEIDLSSFAVEDPITDVKNVSDKIVKHVKDFGYDHVKFLSFAETLTDTPSSDSTAFFFAPSSKLVDADGLKEIVNTLHQNDIGVLFDFNCSCFSSDNDSLKCFDGTCLYEHLDQRQASHPGNNALNFNYKRPEVTDFLISSAMYYLDRFHFDGLCVNDLSSMLYLDYGKREGEWLPNSYGGSENTDGIEFIRHFNSVLKKKYKNVILMAGEKAAYKGVTSPIEEDGLGFDLKFNNGFSDDYLDYISFDPYFRSHHHNELTFSMVYQYSENFICGFPSDYSNTECGPLIDNMPGEDPERIANLRLSYAYLFMHPGKKMLFMGPDFGADNVSGTSCHIDFGLLRKNANKGLRSLIRELNKLYKQNRALYELDDVSDGFEWINCLNSNDCTLSFLRKGRNEKDVLLIACNFAGIIRQMTVGTPFAGKYKEILNTDDKDFGGSNIINTRTKVVSEKEADGRDYSIEVKLAPLSLAVFKYVPFTEQEKYKIEKRKEAIIADSRAKEFKEEAMIAKLEYDEAKAAMEEARDRMNEADARVKKALENEKKELSKAKKALEEAK